MLSYTSYAVFLTIYNHSFSQKPILQLVTAIVFLEEVFKKCFESNGRFVQVEALMIHWGLSKFFWAG